MKIKKIIIVHKEVNDIHLNKDPFGELDGVQEARDRCNLDYRHE